MKRIPSHSSFCTPRPLMRHAVHLVALILSLALQACGSSGGDGALANNGQIALVGEYPLGLAYADSSINVSVFREQSISRLSDGSHVAAYYDQHGDVRIDHINKSGLVEVGARLSPRLPAALLADGHCGGSLGRSADGRIHVIYGAHATQPYYASFPEQLLLNGAGPPDIQATPWPRAITYPQFYLENGVLNLWYRADPESAIQHMAYSSLAGAFEPADLLNFSLEDASGAYAYMNQLATQGPKIALSWLYRLPSLDDDLVRNEGLFLALSPDAGQTWSEANGTPISLPVVRGVVSPFLDVPDSQQPLNQTSSAFGPDGRLYLTYYAKNDKGVHQIFLAIVSPDGSMDGVTQVSANVEQFDLLGRGTLVLPLSRPQIAVSENYIHVFYRQDEQIVFASRPTNDGSAAWTYSYFDVGPLGAWEPTFDRDTWLENRHLLVYVQEARQGALDTGEQGEPALARVLVFAERTVH